MIKCLNFNLISYSFHLTPSCFHIHSFHLMMKNSWLNGRSTLWDLLGFLFSSIFINLVEQFADDDDDEDMRVVESTIDKSPSISLLRINFLNFIYATENDWMDVCKAQSHSVWMISIKWDEWRRKIICDFLCYLTFI